MDFKMHNNLILQLLSKYVLTLNYFSDFDMFHRNFLIEFGIYANQNT